MGSYRITDHPVLTIPRREQVTFTWNGKSLCAYEGEMLSSALIANGIHVFGHHPKDNSPQGLFCANGQCSQCLVIADGLPVKACMTALRSGMRTQSVEGLPKLPLVRAAAGFRPIRTHATDVLIIGAGPAGLAATIELGRLNIPTLVVDDKHRPGGKLVLQTHKFFGSQADSFAGTRGYEIGDILARTLAALPSVQIRLGTTAVGVFADRKIGLVRKDTYSLVKPQKLLVATGAREKMLAFPGNTLPGVYGAGAFQTLVNRDLDVFSAGEAREIAEASAAMFTGRMAGHAIAKALGLVKVQAYYRFRGRQDHAGDCSRYHPAQFARRHLLTE